MTSATNSDLQIPYQIRTYIASQVPYLNGQTNGRPWAEYAAILLPNPHFHQMKQGILLEVIDETKPYALCTRYGSLVILNSSSGAYGKVFEVIKQRLNLRKIDELSQQNRSFWAIQSWNGVMVAPPIKAKKEEFIPPAESDKTCINFIDSQIKKNQRSKL